MPSPRLPLLPAGAFQALHSSDPSRPNLGVTLPLQTPDQLRQLLSRGDITPITLLCPPRFAQTCPADLWAATRQGHEIAGSGHPDHIGLLGACAGQPVRFWHLPEPRREDLKLLRSWHIRLLPTPQKTEPGAIVQTSLAQAPAQLQNWRARGYRPQPVGQLPGLRSITPADLGQHVYNRLVEEPFTRKNRVIDLTERADALLRVAPLDHAPPPLPLPANTPTAELHLHSPRLVGLASRSAVATYRATVRSLYDVGEALQTRPELAEAQAVFAVSLLSGLLEKAGFTLLDLPPRQARWYGLGFRLLRVAYGTLQTPSNSLPRMAWMEREAFLARYGKRGLSPVG